MNDMICIRGAIQAENTKESIWKETEQLVRQMLEENQLALQEVVALQFTVTKDLDQAYPAVAARKVGLTEAALSCVQEMYVEGSLPRCIRANLWVENGKKQSQARHIYLGGAKVLRPDLAAKQSKNAFAIAIDGPAGSGKSTVAKEVAKELDFVYIDTGAMYRAVSLYCIRKGISPRDGAAVEAALAGFSMELKREAGQMKVFLDGEDVTTTIRTQEVGQGASDVALLLPVREKLVELQRQMAEGQNVIMDGRDIGTNALPKAQVKVYLVATAEERAKRRVGELEQNGQKAVFATVLQQIEERDHNDTTREHNPLRKAADAVEIDSTHMTIAQVKEAIIDLVKEKREA